jgi:hypothetical protein
MNPFLWASEFVCLVERVFYKDRRALFHIEISDFPDYIPQNHC